MSVRNPIISIFPLLIAFAVSAFHYVTWKSWYPGFTLARSWCWFSAINLIKSKFLTPRLVLYFAQVMFPLPKSLDGHKYIFIFYSI